MEMERVQRLRQLIREALHRHARQPTPQGARSVRLHRSRHPADGMLYSTRQMLSLPEPLRKNIEFTWYEGGHMFYLNPPDLEKMHIDLLKFIKQAK